MKILKTLGIILGVLIALILLIPAFLDSEKTIERSITVNAPVKSCFVLVNDLKSWPKWSAWYKMDTTSNLVYSEPASGVNAWYTWASTNSQVGEGKLTITHSSLDSVVVSLAFKSWGENSATYFFESLGDNETKVGTRMRIESAGYLGRWMVLLMSSNLANMFDLGLADLKKEAEAAPVNSAVSRVESIEETMLTNLLYIYQRDSVPSHSINETLDKAYSHLMGALHASGLEMNGAPFAIYRSYDPNGICVMESALPVNEMKALDGIQSARIDSQLVLQANYYGTPEDSEMAHEMVISYAETKGYEIVGDPLEIYVTDPKEEKDPYKVLTQIVYPVKKK